MIKIGIIFITLWSVAAHADTASSKQWSKVLKNVETAARAKKGASCPLGPDFESGWKILKSADGTIDCQVDGQPAPMVNVTTYNNDSKFTIEKQTTVNSTAVTDAIAAHPDAFYIGSGPIFGNADPRGYDGPVGDDQPKGYLKSNGKKLSRINCFPDSNDGNWGDDNSVFVAFRDRDGRGIAKTTGDFKYRVVPYEFICKQCGVQSYVDQWKAANPGKTDSDFQTQNKDQNSDLFDCDQIDFAVQSGPLVIKDGISHATASTKTDASFRSFIGVTKLGKAVTVDVDGHASLQCIAQVMAQAGISDLLHRDSTTIDFAHKNKAGEWERFKHPTTPKIESVLIVN